MFIWYSEENCGEIVDGSPNGQKCLYRVSLPFALRGAILNVRGYPQSRQTRGRLRDYDFHFRRHLSMAPNPLLKHLDPKLITF